MKKQISIEGMSCGHCVKHVEGALSEVTGVAKVDVSLEGKYAIVELKHAVPDAALKEAVEEAGYEAVAIKEI
jgi:copper ion binding protein